MSSDIARWDPLRELSAMRAEMERMMARAAGSGTLPRRWSPVSDVIETEDALVITAELPGVKDEDVHITVHDGVLRVSGHRALEEEAHEDRFHRIERSYGDFERTFVLPRGVREDEIHAGVAYGVLKVTVPKPAGAEPRVIAVNPAG